jgi:hypothetical protein
MHSVRVSTGTEQHIRRQTPPCRSGLTHFILPALQVWFLHMSVGTPQETHATQHFRRGKLILLRELLRMQSALMCQRGNGQMTTSRVNCQELRLHQSSLRAPGYSKFRIEHNIVITEDRRLSPHQAWPPSLLEADSSKLRTGSFAHLS